MKDFLLLFHLVMALASETSMPLSGGANRDPVYQSRINRLGRIKYKLKKLLVLSTNVGSSNNFQ